MSPADAVRVRMRQVGVDLLAVPPGDDFLYLSGYTPHPDERPCYLFVTLDGGLFVVPEINAAEAGPWVPVPTLAYADAEGPRRALEDARTKLGPVARIAVGDAMRADALLLLQETWPEARYLPGADVMAALRMIKSPEETAALRRAAAAADVAMEAILQACRPGLRETDLARIAEEVFTRQGAEEVPFVIIASGPNSAFPHHRTSTRVLQAGEPVLIDIGCRLDRYMSDITRMAFLGAPTSPYRKVHAVVEEAVAAGMAAVRPGVPIREVDRAARDVIGRAGYGQSFTHRTGHGIGLTTHEPPSITATNATLLREGMTFSIEPGIYLVGEFGVRLEEIVEVTASGAERLSRLPRQVYVVGPGV